MISITHTPTSHSTDIAMSHRLYRTAPTQEKMEVRMRIPTKKAGYAIGPLLTMTSTLSSTSLDDDIEVVALKSATNTKIQMDANSRRRMATTITASRYPQPQQESHHPPSCGCCDKGTLVLVLFEREEHAGVPTEGVSDEPVPSETVEMLILLPGGGISSASSC